ncbi:hypothetical protein NDU88_003467 [Pleurodeles waltl]|uniref:Uncharacterized protein n=1 Tax=Pleurodeles waltl TaxID=8319 RepID=A0AAV7VG45_PLEWA|nr:hypothetical protein NDU88_003467 [Pleurodeles waltl]
MAESSAGRAWGLLGPKQQRSSSDRWEAVREGGGGPPPLPRGATARPTDWAVSVAGAAWGVAALGPVASSACPGALVPRRKRRGPERNLEGARRISSLIQVLTLLAGAGALDLELFGRGFWTLSMLCFCPGRRMSPQAATGRQRRRKRGGPGRNRETKEPRTSCGDGPETVLRVRNPHRPWPRWLGPAPRGWPGPGRYPATFLEQAWCGECGMAAWRGRNGPGALVAQPWRCRSPGEVAA